MFPRILISAAFLGLAACDSSPTLPSLTGRYELAMVNGVAAPAAVHASVSGGYHVYGGTVEFVGSDTLVLVVRAGDTQATATSDSLRTTYEVRDETWLVIPEAARQFGRSRVLGNIERRSIGGIDVVIEHALSPSGGLATVPIALVFER